MREELKSLSLAGEQGEAAYTLSLSNASAPFVGLNHIESRLL
jgi:hypothetical protein